MVVLNALLLFVVLVYVYPLKFLATLVFGQLLDPGSTAPIEPHQHRHRPREHSPCTVGAPPAVAGFFYLVLGPVRAVHGARSGRRRHALER